MKERSSVEGRAERAELIDLIAAWARRELRAGMRGDDDAAALARAMSRRYARLLDEAEAGEGG